MNSIMLLNAFPDKKIKSIGNKELIKLSNTKCLIDYKIDLFNTLYHHPEIIIVGGFEGKKLSKYLLSKKYKTKYIEHEPKDIWNSGKSIMEGLDRVSGNSLLISSSSVVLDYSAIPNLQKTKSSFVVYQSQKSENIGCVVDDNNNIVRCFYGLDNCIYDMLFLDSQGIRSLRSIVNNTDISKMYLFEIINLCLLNGTQINMIKTNKKSVQTIDSIDSVKLLESKYKNYA